MATKENKTVVFPAHIRVRRDTLANWTSINPVLDDGELAIVRMPDGSITMRVGTGADSFKNLPDLSNSGADEIHILDNVTFAQPNGTLTTSDYELCVNNNIIGVKTNSEEDAPVIYFYKIGKSNSEYGFCVAGYGVIFSMIIQASKEYSFTIIGIPDSLTTSGNLVKMNNENDTGVRFDLNKDSFGKVQLTLNGAAVGTGITLPKVTIPEYTLEKNGDQLTLKKDGAVVGDPIAIASNKGKLLDYEGNEIFNADQSEDVKLILFDCGKAEIP